MNLEAKAISEATHEGQSLVSIEAIGELTYRAVVDYTRWNGDVKRLETTVHFYADGDVRVIATQDINARPSVLWDAIVAAVRP